MMILKKWNLIKATLIFFGVLISPVQSEERTLADTFAKIVESLPSDIIQSEAEKKILKEAFYHAGTEFADKFSPEISAQLQRQAELILEEKVGAAWNSVGQNALDKSKSVGIGIAVGIVNDLMHAAADAVFKGDDFGVTLAREQAHLWIDVGTESMVFAASAKTPLDQAELVIGLAKASSARVAKSIETGLAVKEALASANLQKKEGELWRNVLGAYILYSKGVSEEWRKTFWRESVLYHLSEYENWMKKYHREHGNFDLLVAFEKKKKWLNEGREEFESNLSKRNQSHNPLPLNPTAKAASSQNNEDQLRDDLTDLDTGGGNTPPDTGGGDGGNGDNGGGNPPASGGKFETYVAGVDTTRTANGATTSIDTLFQGRENAFPMVARDGTFTALGNHTGLEWGEWTGRLEQFFLGTNRVFETTGKGHWLSGDLAALFDSGIPATGSASYQGDIIGTGKVEGIAIGPVASGVEHPLSGEFETTINFVGGGMETRINKLLLGSGPSLSLVNASDEITILGVLRGDYGGIIGNGEYTLGSFSGARIDLSGHLYGDNEDSIGGVIRVEHPFLQGKGIFVGERNDLPDLPDPEPELVENPHLPNSFGRYIDVFDRAGFGSTSTRFTGLTGGGTISTQDNISSQHTDVKGYKVEQKTHLSWGRWEGRISRSNVSINTGHERGYWIAGQLTPTASIPREGTATYTGALQGTVTEYTGPEIINSGNMPFAPEHYHSYPLSGDLKMVVDFGNASVSGKVSDVTYQKEGQNVLWFGQGDLTGTLPDYSGTLKQSPFWVTMTSSSGVSGEFLTQFFGSDAEAVGGSFNLIESPSIKASGVFWGEK